MPNFSYQGVRKDGQRTDGTLLAANVEDAKRQLQQQGIFHHVIA